MQTHPIEINLARRLVNKYGIKPPFTNLSEIVRIYAELCIDRLPVDVDGATLFLNNKKPIILVQAGKDAARTRFTIAHELGHVLIPHHFGNRLDENLNNFIADFDGTESEANRFAAELLMPEDWTANIIKSSPDVRTAINLVHQQANVSRTAAILRVTSLLPAGFMCVRVDKFGKVIFSMKSPNSMMRTVAKNDTPDFETVFAPATDKWIEPSSEGGKFLFAQFSTRMRIDVEVSHNDWRGILDHILSDVSVSENESVKLKQSINGIFGAANSALKEDRNLESLCAAFRQRILNRCQDNSTFAKILDHPNLPRLLKSKAMSILASYE